MLILYCFKEYKLFCSNYTFDEIAYEIPNPDCDKLEVTCVNDDQWGTLEDPHGCFIPYCLDGCCKLFPLSIFLFGYTFWDNPPLKCKTFWYIPEIQQCNKLLASIFKILFQSAKPPLNIT